MAILTQVEINNEVHDLGDLVSRDTLGYSRKNWLPVTGVDKTANGATFTVNADKSITVTADPATADTSFTIIEDLELPPGETFILSGCPAGGSGSTYKMYLLEYLEGYETSVAQIYEYGDEIEFTTHPASHKIKGFLWVAGEQTHNLTFYPMIRRAEIADDTYEPYHEKTVENRLSDLEALGGISSDSGLITRGKEITRADYNKLGEEKLTDNIVYYIEDDDTDSSVQDPETGNIHNQLFDTDVVDNLLSNSTNLPLSANQGRLLAERLDGLTLQVISESDYEILETNGTWVENTLYIITE